MNTVSPWRLAFIGGVTILCLALFTPSARYLLALTDPKADPEKVEELRSSSYAIPLGLDLRGGVDVTLRIDDEKARKEEIANYVRTIRDDLTEAKLSANVTASEDGDAIVLRVTDKADARNIANRLAGYEDLRGDLSQENLERMEPVTVEVREDTLSRHMAGQMQSVEKIVRERLDKFGLTQPSISVIGDNRIRVQVPGEKDPDKLIDNLTTLAKMEFRLAHEQYGTPSDPINQLLDPATGELRPDAIVPLGYEVLPYKFGRTDKETGQIVYDQGKMLVAKEAALTGESLRQTGVQQDPSDIDNPIKVSLVFNEQGSRAFGDMTRASVEKLRQTGQPDHLAIVLDGEVRSSPRLGVLITGGSAVIEGGFTFEEADDLSKLLKAGSLPAPLVPESKRTVGPSLGTESIVDSVEALAYGTLAIVVFMVFYYGAAGAIAVAALLLNVLIILAALVLARATLTLAGIGGILLTVGMAVDANVLIYERIREEIDSGRSMKQAIQLGFGRAFAVILDSNLTTLMTALVLLQFAEGSIKGFALTMTFGLIANLYTGLTVTHTLCSLWFQWRGKLGLGALRFLREPKIDFIRMRKVSLGGSVLLIAIGLGLLVAQGGLKFGVDFGGGLLADVRFAEATSESAIREAIQAGGLTGERIQRIPGSNDYVIRVKVLEGESDGGDLDATETALVAGLKQTYGEEKFEVLSLDYFGSETGQEFRTIAITVVLLASIAILIYLWLRFELVFGVAAVLAVIHDLFVTVTLGSLWGVEITLDVVASLMVLLGFSVNDTIVNFDRIRENMRKEGGRAAKFGEVVNLSLNQSLSRTVITSGTLVVVVIALLVFGGEGLRPFGKVLLIGAIVGSYSSIFVAAPVVYMWNERTRNRLAAALAAKKSSGPEPAKAPSRSGAPNLPKSRI